MTERLECPECGEISLVYHPLYDGSISLCTACGFEELIAGSDIELQFQLMDEIDPSLAESWRETIALQLAPAGRTTTH